MNESADQLYSIASAASSPQRESETNRSSLYQMQEIPKSHSQANPLDISVESKGSNGTAGNPYEEKPKDDQFKSPVKKHAEVIEVDQMPEFQTDEDGEIIFNDSEDITRFFNRVGHNLRNNKLLNQLNEASLSIEQKIILEGVMNKRQQELQNLNTQIYSSFSKLFFFVQYMQELVNQQLPFYNSYKSTFKNLRHAYIKVAH